MQKAARQEPTSDEILIAVYQSLLRYWIKQQVPQEKAEDLAQEGLLKCLLKAHQWKGTASLKTFLTAVGKNAGYDFLRKEARQERIKQRNAEVNHSRK